jgi:hypothetical protein
MAFDNDGIREKHSSFFGGSTKNQTYRPLDRDGRTNRLADDPPVSSHEHQSSRE